MSEYFTDLFACPACASEMHWFEDRVECKECASFYVIKDGLPRFVEGTEHENFNIQWKKFYDVQLDSVNGTTCSRDRLLEQSELSPEAFRGKTILEVGCGAGRFTEVLLGFGARVVAVDYSRAVEVCASSNSIARTKGKLFAAQADAFHLPFKLRAFDIVLGYGMLQHTGSARRALECLWEEVRPGGILLVDRYQLSLRCTHPVKYMLRPVLKRLPNFLVLHLAEWTCKVMVPFQKFLLSRLRGEGWRKYVRYIVNRSLNSTYPINLAILGKLDHNIAFRWSVLDTFDMWAPRYDSPQTFRFWIKDLESLGGEIIVAKTGGQGNVGAVRRLS